MPVKPPKPCKKAGCNRLTTASDGYCEKHTGLDKKQADERRGSAVERGYDGKWHKIRNQKLKADPFCERCTRTVIADLVHHKDHNPKNNEWENLESLCQEHHDEEHKDERWWGREKSSGLTVA